MDPLVIVEIREAAPPKIALRFFSARSFLICSSVNTLLATAGPVSLIPIKKIHVVSDTQCLLKDVSFNYGVWKDYYALIPLSLH